MTSRCRSCRNKAYVEYFRNNPEKQKARNLKTRGKRKEYYSRPEVKLRNRDAALKRTFGIGLKEYNRMLKKQEGKCAICKTENPRVIRRKTGNVQNFHVDHCHRSGKVRGLLCPDCNRGLGSFKDNVKFLAKAIGYLKMKG